MADKYTDFHDAFIALCLRFDVEAAYLLAKPDVGAPTHTIITDGDTIACKFLDAALQSRMVLVADNLSPHKIN